MEHPGVKQKKKLIAMLQFLKEDILPPSAVAASNLGLVNLDPSVLLLFEAKGIFTLSATVN